MERRNNHQRAPIPHPARAQDFDPTGNTKDLVYHATQGLKDYVTAVVERIDEISTQKILAINERFKAHLEHGKEMEAAREKEFRTHNENSKEADLNERNRLDALIESVIDTAKETTSKGVETAATLALRVQSTADTMVSTNQDNTEVLRNLITNKVDEAIRTSGTQNEALVKRIIVLEEAKSENTGKERVADPIIAQLLIEMQAIKKKQENTDGAVLARKDLWGWLVGAVALGMAIHSYMK